MSKKNTLKEIMSKMLDNINGAKAANTHTDGSYETKNLVIETFHNQLSILWVYLQTDIEQLQAKLDEANEQILHYEEIEALACPEDVGINEYVACLQKDKQQLRGAIEQHLVRLQEALKDVKT